MQSQRKGLCKCDEDHMYGCGEREEGADGNGSTTRGVADSELERMLESMAKKNRVSCRRLEKVVGGIEMWWVE